MKTFFFYILLFFINYSLLFSLPDSCKLNIGTNLSSVYDWGTEIPVVDMMKMCRTWYTKDADNPDGSPFNTGLADKLTYRSDGYPTHIPQSVTGHPFKQKVATIWAITDGWKPGDYVVIFEGIGELSFWGGISNLEKVNANKWKFTFDNPVGSVLELIIDSSYALNPVRNIRVIHKDYENTYLTEPFNPIWLEKLLVFKTVRFMDWGRTNNWGQSEPWEWDDSTLFNWNERSKGAVLVKKACGVLVILGGLYMIYTAP